MLYLLWCMSLKMARADVLRCPLFVIPLLTDTVEKRFWGVSRDSIVAAQAPRRRLFQQHRSLTEVVQNYYNVRLGLVSSTDRCNIF
jgi:hypothetical protein